MRRPTSSIKKRPHEPEVRKAEDPCNSNKPEADRTTAFDEAAEAWPQLNKLAFWMATGSGKTLLMHANILQYRRALTRHGQRRELNRIILLTPNEGLLGADDSRSVLAVKGSLRRFAPWTAAGRSEGMAVYEGKGGAGRVAGPKGTFRPYWTP